MDPEQFDSLVQTFSRAATRRALTGLLSGLTAPLVPGLAAADRRKGKGRGSKRHLGRGKAGSKNKGRDDKSAQQVDSHKTAGDAPDCRAVGHPCEGNQECCNSGETICVASGPGAAKRCTSCEPGEIACNNACIPACTALDQCHKVGACDPNTGQCSNPAQDDGSPCNDGNLCTQRDTCQQGVCVGSDPVVCTAQDQCHVAGVCDTQTGECSNPAKTDGTACDDGNPCTQGDTCQAGTCKAGPTVSCPASACRLEGTCDPQTGTCLNPAAPDGTPCNGSSGCFPSPVARQGCGVASECFSGTCETCSGVAFPCDGGTDRGSEPWPTRCCPENGTCQISGRDGRRRCCHPDGTACLSNESLAQLACCGGYCNTESGRCSSACTARGHDCRNHDECCSGNCRGLSPAGPGHCD